MHNLTPNQRDNGPSSLAGLIFWACGGLAIASLGVLSFPTSSLSYDVVSEAARSLFLVFLGLVSAIGAFSQFRLQRKLGDTSVLVSESVLRPGDHFFVTFQQDLLSDVQVSSIGVFLVYRETVQEKVNPFRARGALPRPRTFDRLVHGFMRDIEDQSPGETIPETREFAIPTRDMGFRHPFNPHNIEMVVAHWAIKIKVDFVGMGSRRFEYLLNVEPLSTDPPVQPTSGDEDLFDLYMVKNTRFGIGRDAPLDVALPHQIFFLGLTPHFVRNILLLERRSRAELQSIKNKLELAGIVTEIRRAL